MGGDLKWLATVYGLNAANSNYPCPWCFWKNEQMTNIDLNKNWQTNQRNVRNSTKLANKKSIDEKKGHIKEPLFKFIDFNQCIVDVLHLFLRVTDKLFKLLLNRLEQLDTTFSGYKTGKIEDMRITKIFLDFLKSCDITAPFYVKVQDNVSKYKLRKLNKNERLRLFKKLFTNNCLIEIFSKCRKEIKEDNELLTLNFVFSEFYKIYKELKIDYEDKFIKQRLINQLKDWLKNFIIISPEITPYIHILTFHVPDMIEKFGCLRNYSMQGLEKFNHISKINYFKQTDHRNAFHKILIKKINRLELINLND